MTRLAFILMISLISAAQAGDKVVTVRDQQGEPVPGMWLIGPEGSGADIPATYEWPNMMQQKDLQFQPHVLIVPVGSDVEFPNRDRVRHHVYSFSKGNRFELKLYGREEKRYVTFENTGIVAVGCNIHDDMIGYIRVVDTPFVHRTDENGQIVLSEGADIPSTAVLWHPDVSKGEDQNVSLADDEVHLTIQRSGKDSGKHHH